MSNLINIEIREGNQAISARELHIKLNLTTRFNDWIKRMFDYGFTEGKDFYSILSKTKIGRPSTDYALSMDCAKHIAMIQRTPEGKAIRQYLIECEKKLTLSPAEQLLASVQLTVDHEKRMKQVESRVAEVEAKVTTIDTNFYSVAGWFGLHGKSVALRDSQAVARAAKKLSVEMGFLISKVYDARYGQVNTYHQDVLATVTEF